MEKYIWGLIAIVAWVALILILAVVVRSEPIELNYKCVPYIVEKGDTLSGLADKHCYDRDPREWQYEVVRINERLANAKGKDRKMILDGEKLFILVRREETS